MRTRGPWSQTLRVESNAHKLLRTTISIAGNKISCQREEKHTYPPEDGQHNSSDIHIQIWGHSLPRAESTNQRVVDVVPRQEHNITSHPPCRDSELYSRRRVMCDEGLIRLDAVPQSIQQNQPKSGTTTGGPICLLSVSPVQEPFLLPLIPTLIIPTHRVNKPDIVPRLAMWVISEIDSEAKTFQRRLQISSWPPGRLKHQSHTTPYLENGYAGAIRGTQIPFLEI